MPSWIRHIILGECFSGVKRKAATLCIAIISFPLSSGFSQDTADSVDTFDVGRRSFILPNRTPAGEFRNMVSISRYFLPSDWTNIAINAPMFNYTARYSLPQGFSIEGGVSTLFISNKFILGPRWTWSIKNFHAGASYQYGYNFGFLNEWGYSTLVTSWSHLPALLVGYSFPKSAITLKVGLEYIGNISYKTGENVTRSSDFKLNGSLVSLNLEQRLTKGHMMVFVFEIDHVNFAMVAWPAFPVNNKTYYVPQVSWGYIF